MTENTKKVIKNIFLESLLEFEQKKKYNQLPQPQQDRLLTRKEAANLLKVSLVTIFHRMKDGSIKYHRLGRKIFFKESEIFSALK